MKSAESSGNSEENIIFIVLVGFSTSFRLTQILVVTRFDQANPNEGTSIMESITEVTWFTQRMAHAFSWCNWWSSLTNILIFCARSIILVDSERNKAPTESITIKPIGLYFVNFGIETLMQFRTSFCTNIQQDNDYFSNNIRTNSPLPYNPPQKDSQNQSCP